MSLKNKISAIINESGFALQFNSNVVFIPVFFYSTFLCSERYKRKLVPQNFKLGFLPYLLGKQTDTINSIGVEKAHKNNSHAIEVSLNAYNSPAFLNMKILNPSKQNKGFVEYYRNDTLQGTYEFFMVPSEVPVSYRVRLSMQYNWFATQPNSILVRFPLQESKLENMELLINSSQTD